MGNLKMGNTTDSFDSTAYSDQPIFILRFRRFAVGLHLIAWLILSFLLYGIAFAIPPRENILREIIFRPVGAFLFLYAVYMWIDLAFFKEIRLYNNRLEKSWHFFRSRTIFFENAMLKGSNYHGRWRWIYNTNANVLLRYASCIIYMEDMASKEDAKKMSRLMAEMSGRDPKEFEGFRFSFKKLLKEKK